MMRYAMAVLVVTLCLPALVAAQPRETLSLDGAWEILFDPGNVGRASLWYQEHIFSARNDRQTIEVPCCWERIRRDYEGVAFYRRSFQVPSDWTDKIIRLQFDAVNYLTEVWLNDEVVGTHEGGFTPFEFRVDNLILPGQDNTLMLRVVGPIILQDKNIDGMGPLETPQWRGGITGGVWQSVRLIATGEAVIRDVFLQPQFEDNSVLFHLQLENTGTAGKTIQVEASVQTATAGVAVTSSRFEISLRPGVTHHTRRLAIPQAQYWSPDNPHLYLADVTLAESDHWSLGSACASLRSAATSST